MCPIFKSSIWYFERFCRYSIQLDIESLSEALTCEALVPFSTVSFIPNNTLMFHDLSPLVSMEYLKQAIDLSSQSLNWTNPIYHSHLEPNNGLTDGQTDGLVGHGVHVLGHGGIYRYILFNPVNFQYNLTVTRWWKIEPTLILQEHTDFRNE